MATSHGEPQPLKSRDDHNAHRQFERLVFFSDAVFAIAITLLVLDLRAPAGPLDRQALQDIFPKVLGFGISFFVIGIYWIAHHELFGALEREDGPLKVANLAFLASIVFLPFPTSVIAGRVNSTASVVFYALSVASVGLLLVMLTLVARRPALMRAGETRGRTLGLVMRSLSAPLVFIASAIVAIWRPNLAALLWLAVWPAVRLGAMSGRAMQRRLERANGA
jgi:uncharacterized membrane protein